MRTDALPAAAAYPPRLDRADRGPKGNQAGADSLEPEARAIDEGRSPAKAARTAIAERPELGGQPFGRIVSALARGLDLTTLFPPPAIETPAADGDIAEAGVSAEEGEAEAGTAAPGAQTGEAGPVPAPVNLLV